LQIITPIFSTRRNPCSGNERTFRQKPCEVKTRIVYRSFKAHGPRHYGQDSCSGVMHASSVASSVSVQIKTAKLLWKNRYYVTSMTPNKASRQNLQQASRVHWRIENEVHWTSDVIFREDARRTPLSKPPTAILVVAMLRTMARDILAMLRSKSRFREASACGDRRDPNQRGRSCAPSWRHVLESLLQMLFVPLLDTTAILRRQPRRHARKTQPACAPLVAWHGVGTLRSPHVRGSDPYCVHSGSGGQPLSVRDR
jgi:hypothetical protein